MAGRQCGRSLETAVIRIDMVLAARKEEAVIEAKGADSRRCFEMNR